MSGAAASAPRPRSSAACGAPTRGRGRTWPRRITSRCSRRCSTPRASARVPAVLDVGCGSGLTLVLAARARRDAQRAGHQPGPAGHRPRAAARRPTCAKATWSRCRSATPRSTRCRRQRVPVRRRPAAGAARGGPGHPARRPRGGQPVRGARALPGHGRARGHERAHPARAGRRPRPVRPVGAGQPGGRPGRRWPARAGQRRGRVLLALRSMDDAVRACSAPRAAPGPASRRASTRSATSCGTPRPVPGPADRASSPWGTRSAGSRPAGDPSGAAAAARGPQRPLTALARAIAEYTAALGLGLRTNVSRSTSCSPSRTS